MQDTPITTRQQVIDAVHDALDQRSRIDATTHADHHQFVGHLISRYQRRRELTDKVKQQVVGWGVILLLGGIGTAVYHYVANISQRIVH